MNKILLLATLYMPLYGIAYATDETSESSGASTPVPEPAPAATPPAAQAKAEAPVNNPKLWIDTPYFKGYIPGVQVSVISLFDFVNSRPLVGAETPLFAVKRVQFTAGGVTSIDGIGSPYIGGHLLIPNPTPSLVFLNDLELGGFGGRDFHEGKYMAGVKIGKQIW